MVLRDTVMNDTERQWNVPDTIRKPRVRMHHWYIHITVCMIEEMLYLGRSS